MTYAISVPTPFTDIADLAESFASRVDEERVMLPHYEHIPEGEWVQFAVTFADGSSAIAGIGRCTNAVDNGDDRAPEHRFDVVLDSLQLDEMGQVYFERILMVRAAEMGQEPQTGEVQVPDDFDAAPSAAGEVMLSFDHGAGGEADPYAAEAAPEQAYAEQPYAEQPYAEQPAEAYGEPEAAYAQAQPYEPVAEQPAYEAPVESAYEPPPDDVGFAADDALAEAAAEAAPAPSRRRGERLSPPVHAIYELPPPSPPGELPSPHANGASPGRRGISASWSPVPMQRPERSPSSGLFQYGDRGLPQPGEPPRPQMDPALRVVRAPRSSDPLAAPLMRSVAAGGAAAAVAYQEEAYAQGYTEEAAYGEEYAQGYDDAEGYAEGEAQPAEASDEYGTETMQVDLGEDEDQY